MNRLVEIRVNDAIENIQRIEEAMSKAIDRRKSAKALEKSLLSLIEPSRVIARLVALVQQCRFIAQYPAANQKLKMDLVVQAENAVEDLKGALSHICSSAHGLGNYRFDQKQIRRHEERTNGILKGRRKQLKKLQSGSQLPQQNPAQLLQIIEEEKPLWGEHIETVAGMVLRDDGFDAGLSVVSDAIVLLCTGTGPRLVRVRDTLNVLGRDQTVVKDLNQTVYFRFPGWSVWGLPLTAHDVWHASDQGGEDFRDELTSVPQALEMWNAPLVQDCLADAFATYVMGPAYAFACILLLLDVHSPQDRVRANIVFTALRFISECAEDEDCPLAMGLEKMWRETCEHEAGRSPQENRCLLGHQCEVVDALVEAYYAGKKDVTTISCEHASVDGPCPMTNTALIETMCDALLKFMPKKLRYSDDAWVSKSAELERHLKNTKQTVAAPELRWFADNELDLRHILRATWHLRWMDPQEETDALCQLAVNTKNLCLAMLPPILEGEEMTQDVNGSDT